MASLDKRSPLPSGFCTCFAATFLYLSFLESPEVVKSFLVGNEQIARGKKDTLSAAQ